MLGIASHCEQGFGAGAEQQAVDLAFVLQGQWRRLVRQRKDHMDVACGQKFFLSRLEPEVARVGLTLRAVPVAAGAERDGLMSAARTRIYMSAECGGTATQDRQEHLQVLPGEPLSAAL